MSQVSNNNGLFSPLKIRDVTFKNRIAVSPMCMYSSEDGFYNEWHLVHLGSRAVGGAGLVFTEATAVEPEGRISPSDAGLWKDEHIDYLKVITSFLKKHGSVAGIQLSHAGRKGSANLPWSGDQHLKNEEGGWDTKGASPISFDSQHLWKVPQEISIEEIQNIQQKFVESAERAVKAGFQVIEIHAAHGYLLHQFLTPLANQRTDQYGGSLENRIRFLLEVTQKVKSVLPQDVLLFVRLNSKDYLDNGFTLDEAVETVKQLKTLGVDLIDSSSGFVVPDWTKMPFGPGFQVEFAERFKKEADILTGAVGVIVDPEQANTIIEEGKADLVFLAREYLRDPYFAYHAAVKLNQDQPQKTLPVQYSHFLGRH